MLKATTEQLSDPIVLYGIELRNANKRKAEDAKDDCGCQQLITLRHIDNSKMKKKNSNPTKIGRQLKRAKDS